MLKSNYLIQAQKTVKTKERFTFCYYGTTIVFSHMLRLNMPNWLTFNINKE